MISINPEIFWKNFYYKSTVAVSVAGRNSKIKRNNEMEYTIAAEPGGDSFLFLISSTATFQKENDAEKDVAGLNMFAAAEGLSRLLENHQNWQHKF